MKKTDFIKLVRVIYDTLDQPLSLDELASRVGMSLASLKRICQEAINQSPGAFIRRLRMECAFRSLQNREMSVLEIALAVGFDDHSSFSRRFRETFGYSPTQAREKTHIVNELECVVLEEPDLVELNDISVQTMTETGYYFEAAPNAWQGLQKKLHVDELSDDFSGVFIGIGHDDPHEGKVSEDQCRFSACVSHIQRDIGAENLIISGGAYARFRFVGKPNNLGLAYHYIYGQWSAKSSVKFCKNKPAFILFDRFPQAFDEHHLMIHVPID